MRRSTRFASLAAAALTFGMAVPAQAALIDFTDGGWSSTNPRNFGSLTVTLTAFDDTNTAVNFTETVFDGDPGQCGPLACESDGIGIGDDEVTFGTGGKTDVERLLVEFSKSVNISSIILLDLFGADSSTDTPAEVVQMQFNGSGAGGGWSGTAPDTTGFFTATSGNADKLSDPNAFFGVSQIEFFADTAQLSSPDNTDFALAAINVPEPGILALFGLGLLGLVGSAGRRRQS